jgi:hypothetical protein
MQLVLSRASVGAGDDLDSHDERVTIEDGLSLEAIIEHVLDSHYLPSIAGGRATWSVWTKLFERDSPVAVVAQEWQKPNLLGRSQFYGASHTEIALRFSYHAQRAPNTVRKF